MPSQGLPAIPLSAVKAHVGPVIGLFVGIDMILNGEGWIMLAIGLRNAPAAESVA